MQVDEESKRVWALIYIRIHTYINVYIYIYICIYIYVCVHTYVYLYTHIHTHIYVHTYIYTGRWGEQESVGAHIYMRIHTYIYTYIYVCVHTYIFIYTHIYTQVDQESKRVWALISASEEAFTKKAEADEMLSRAIEDLNSYVAPSHFVFCSVSSLPHNKKFTDKFPKKAEADEMRHCTMGWLRLVGSLKLYISLKNIGLFCRALLQKRPIILRSLLTIATPYRRCQFACSAQPHFFFWTLYLLFVRRVERKLLRRMM